MQRLVQRLARRAQRDPRIGPRSGRRRTEAGAVTAEAALVMPVLAAVTLALVWMLGLAVTQVRVTDAAREAARAVARGDPIEEARALARTAAPGAAVRIESGGPRVRVHVVTTVRPPGDLLGHLAAARIEASAEALAEGVVASGAGADDVEALP